MKHREALMDEGKDRWSALLRTATDLERDQLTHECIGWCLGHDPLAFIEFIEHQEELRGEPDR